MQSEIKNIIGQMKAMQKGGAWHGNSLEEALKGLDNKTAAKIPFEGAHSIWEYILHLSAWRQFALDKIKGNTEAEIIIGGALDWPTIEHKDHESWERAKDHLAHTSKELQEVLAQEEVKLLREKVSGKDYSFYILLHGIVQHDAYHCGQIVLSRKILAQIPESRE
ncbi:MAG: DinB family protein [Bacteroidota bacterium]